MADSEPEEGQKCQNGAGPKTVPKVLTSLFGTLRGNRAFLGDDEAPLLPPTLIAP